MYVDHETIGYNFSDIKICYKMLIWPIGLRFSARALEGQLVCTLSLKLDAVELVYGAYGLVPS